MNHPIIRQAGAAETPLQRPIIKPFYRSAVVWELNRSQGRRYPMETRQCVTCGRTFPEVVIAPHLTCSKGCEAVRAYYRCQRNRQARLQTALDDLGPLRLGTAPASLTLEDVQTAINRAHLGGVAGL